MRQLPNHLRKRNLQRRRKLPGSIIPLITYENQTFRKVTAARYKDGKLYINYAKVVDKKQYLHRGIFDVENNFASLAEIQIQNISVSNNHSSMDVLGNKAYYVYQEDETGVADILAQAYEWQ